MERLLKCQSAERVAEEMQRSVSALGVENYMLSCWSKQTEGGQPGPSALTNYDGSWLAELRGGRYRDDAVLRHADATKSPFFTWDRVELVTPAEKRFMGDAADAVGAFGASGTLPGPRGMLGAVSFCAHRDMDADQISERLFARAAAAHLRIIDIEFERGREGVALTGKELETLKWMTTPLKVGEIAERMGVRPATVETHVQNIFQKFGVSSRVSAVTEGLLRGLVGVPDFDPE